jgi:hypothetical protein
MLNPTEAAQIVDDSIFMAGGDQGPFPADPTLKQAVHNYASKIQKQGSGSVGRVFGSLSVYQQLGTERLELVGHYQIRKPMTDEVFQRKPTTRGDPQFSLTSKSRHYVELGLDWSPSESLSYLTLKPKYRHGSAPPAFNFLEHPFSISPEFKADVNK